MNRSGLVLRMFMRERMAWFVIPWLVTLSSFVINLIIGGSLHEEQNMVTGGLASFFIYMFVMGIIIVSQFFPFALGFSIRRTDFFLGSTAMIAIASAAASLIIMLFSYAETDLTDHWGVQLQFFNLPFVHDGAWYVQLLVHFVLALHMFFAGYFIGMFNRRFRATWTFILFIALSLVAGIASMLCTRFGWWDEIGRWFLDQTALSLTLWSLPLVLIYMLASYKLTRTATA
ncbi:hypothetical protein FHS18_002851 [Paenibacillus phyllosphaerae]|uniref:Uncharacterized protein n=1 Tax=Paenibacillus phyllosphaerae TaxID=274593 RepID=A0A7W5AYF5_9BACL|nr:hypothetical protein [Paenibacillus phyllosphaerae]MBB3110784.1 hypothetical protein [Paenibacillus phyllosphaerae]